MEHSPSYRYLTVLQQAVQAGQQGRVRQGAGSALLVQAPPRQQAARQPAEQGTPKRAPQSPHQFSSVVSHCGASSSSYVICRLRLSCDKQANGGEGGRGPGRELSSAGARGGGGPWPTQPASRPAAQPAGWPASAPTASAFTHRGGALLAQVVLPIRGQLLVELGLGGQRALEDVGARDDAAVLRGGGTSGRGMHSKSERRRLLQRLHAGPNSHRGVIQPSLKPASRAASRQGGCLTR